VGVAEGWGEAALVGETVGLGASVSVALGKGLGSDAGIGAQPATRSRAVSKQTRG